MSTQAESNSNYESGDVRERDDAVQQSDAHPYLPNVRDLRDTGHDERVERARKQPVQRRVQRERYERVCGGPEQERGQPRTECARHEKCEPPERVCDVCGGDAAEHACRIEYGKHVEGRLWCDACVGCVGYEVTEGREKT